MDFYIEKLYKQVMRDPRFISWEERIIYSHVLNWELDNKVCFTSDEVLADRIVKTVSETSEILRNMERRKLLKRIFQPGVTARIIKTTRKPEQHTEKSLIDIFDIGQENF